MSHPSPRVRSDDLRRPWLVATLALGLTPQPSSRAADPVPVDLSGYRAAAGDGVLVTREGPRLVLTWPVASDERGRLALDLRPGEPLVQGLGVTTGGPSGAFSTVLGEVEPAIFVTVGSRESPPDRPPGMSVFNVFFDSPAKRPHATYQARFEPKSAKVSGGPGRATVVLDGLSAGPFSGSLQVTVYARSKLVHVESVLTTNEPNRAFTYDSGLVARSPDWQRFGWHDTEGKLTTEPFRPDAPDTPHAVRHRVLAVETPGGAVACFPPPHQFFYPRDLTDNQQTVWFGRGHRGSEDRTGFGARQTETGGGNYVPWFNAPPGTAQRMGVFYLVTRGGVAGAISEALRYTNNDGYPALPGHARFTSHWHMATAVAAMREEARGKGKGRSTPDFVKMFKDMNLEIIHLAEFHGDGHPQDPGPLRLPELKAMFDECRRLSDFGPLFLPGEEANVHLGVSKPGRHPGHWLYLFPRPVYWTMTRGKSQPYEEADPALGHVYHVGNRDEMVRLLKDEHGLAWTAHPRIKASNWAPDAYRDTDYYQDPLWLGGAWKAMPADLSSPKLGERVLDLFDDMANWGQKKVVLGEVDVFKVDHTHELYAHMNVNYLRLDRVPKYGDDWSPVLDALRNGKFFVTTGEVLLTDFTVGGKPSGSTLALPPDGRPAIEIGLKWTFPMSFAEVISGDGAKVYRERIDLTDTFAFGDAKRTLRPDLTGRKWVRVEAWDVAANGTFSQAVWLTPGGR